MFDLALIHPMLVHFPLVLIPLAVVLDWLAVAQGEDLAKWRGLARLSLVTWGLGAAFAVLAAMFGDLALDAAVGKGFPVAPLDRHETFGYTTMWLLIGLSALRFLFAWRRLPLRGGRRAAIALGGTLAVAVLITTAFYGGELVYSLGVNVAAVQP